ncbi:MAG: fimbrillin family protein [Bacteroidales bacterium]|nr:fimbrillin family protein [Bacteroidales bacterium]
MKKLLFFASLAIVAAACSKTEYSAPQEQNAISFQAVNYLTKVSGSEFPKTDTFGAYAWTAGTVGEYFIENKEVSFDGTKWTTATPYYWPKNQSVDFFCYYPYNVAGTVPTVSKTQIKYQDIDFTANQVDIMYADKAVGYTDNANQVDDGQNAYEGVPTLFRHAGAKVKVNVILGENQKTEAASGTVTKWDVTLKQVVLSGIYTKGSCTLNLSSDNNGIIPWTKPVNADGYAVWTNDGTLNDTDNTLYKNVQHYNLVKGEGVLVIPEFYALPQALVPGQQRISLVVDIQTYVKNPGDADFSPALNQTDVNVSADLRIVTGDLNTSVYAWQMNHAVTYNITLGAAGRQITFDPAIDNWEPQTFATNIELEI